MGSCFRGLLWLVPSFWTPWPFITVAFHDACTGLSFVWLVYCMVWRGRRS